MTQRHPYINSRSLISVSLPAEPRSLQGFSALKAETRPLFAHGWSEWRHSNSSNYGADIYPSYITGQPCENYCLRQITLSKHFVLQKHMMDHVTISDGRSDSENLDYKDCASRLAMIKLQLERAFSHKTVEERRGE